MINGSRPHSAASPQAAQRAAESPLVTGLTAEDLPAAAPALDDAVVLLRGVRDVDGTLVDAVIELANATWRELTAPGLPTVAGCSFRQDLPALAGDLWPLVVDVLESGLPRVQVASNQQDPGSWLEVHLLPMDGDRVLVTTRPIAVNTRRREAIRRNEARFRMAFDQSPDTIAIFRPLLGEDGLLEDIEAVYINKAALDRWYGGVTLESLAHKRLFEVQPDGRKYLRDLYREVIATGQPFEGVRRYDSPKGLFWAMLRVSVTSEGIIHTSRDVTELMVAKEAQERALRALEEAQRTGRVGSFEWSPAIGELTASREACRLLDVDPVTPDPVEVLRRLGAPSHSALSAELAAAGPAGLERAVVVPLANGEDRHLLLRATLERLDASGELVFGTLVDVSETRRAEARAAEAQALFVTAVNAVGDALAIMDPIREGGALVDLEVVWANTAWLQREHLESLPPGLRVAAQHREMDALRDDVERLLAGGPAVSSEVRLADGQWLAVGAYALGERLVVTSRDISAARQADEVDRARLLSAIDNATDAISIADADGHLVYVNEAFASTTGVSREAAIGRLAAIFRPIDDAGTLSPEGMQLRQGVPWRGVRERPREDDGRTLVVSTAVSPVLGPNGAITGYVGVSRDITAERAEAANREQSERLEAIGRLAGGIAHDFNNMLAAISGYGRFALDSLAAGTEVHEDVSQVLAAARRASELTRQLLLFSHRQQAAVQAVAPAAALEALLPMVRRLIGEQVQIETVLDPLAPSVAMDPGQLDQVLMNLAINARDAMPDGGQLVIRVEGTARDGRPATRITVSDTGTGMTAEVRARIFDPFFTTKDPGSGTGLGLATVYGIVQAAGGSIDVASAPGHGSTFTIVLPAHEAPDEAETEVSPDGAVPRGAGETVLVVEDDASVRAVTERMLKSLGYLVWVADGPGAALEAITSGAPVDLLVTDVRMPGMQGDVLAHWVRAERPAVRVLFVTGMLADLEEGKALDAAVLEKPFTEPALARAVREALTMQVTPPA